ncbi:MAG: hypothetical protein FWE40_06765 [Oscillospiraceae bacterium]|jgi:hypothetical protein|nr:hypothetical protein [Oscillospiraceae bacterium]
MREDFVKMVHAGIGGGFFKFEQRTMNDMLRPDETLLWVHSNVVAANYDNYFGITMISQQRVLHVQKIAFRKATRCIEFQTDTIHSVGVRGKDVYFVSGHQIVRIEGKGDDGQQAQQIALILRQVASGTNPELPQTSVTCSGCAARVMVPVEQVVRCEYCSGALQA